MMSNISDISERISYIIENQFKGNQKKFAESIGYSAQVISNIVSGRKSKPSFEVLNAIISTNDDIDSEWLLTGKGEMLKDLLNNSKIFNDDFKNKYIQLLEENRELHIENKRLRELVGASEGIIFPKPKPYTVAEDDTKGLVRSDKKLK